jgi:hypothetical protein
VHSHLEQAISRTLRDYQEKVILDEPQITDRLLSRVQDALESVNAPNMRFKAITFSPHTEEPLYGADFAGFLVLEFPNAMRRKFFLAQAKRGLTNDGNVTLGNLDNRDAERLISQIRDMLKITPESYVAIYTNEAFRFAPALSIVNTHEAEPTLSLWKTLNARVPLIDAVSFYEQHLECFIGDVHVQERVGFLVDTAEDLKRAIKEFNARAGQLIYAVADRPVVTRSA